MTSIKFLRRAMAATALSTFALGAFAGEFATTGNDFSDSLRGNRSEITMPGTKGWVTGRAMAEGQKLTFRRGNTVLNEDPLVVGADGTFSFEFDVPADAAVGRQPITVTAENPDGAGIMMLKVSPKVEFLGQEMFSTTSADLARGIYQVASGKDGKLFIAASSGRGEALTSVLMKLDASSLAPEGEATPPMGEKGMVNAVYGVGADNAKGTIWATNTRENSVTIYDQADLSVIKTFPAGSVDHPRDAVVDEAAGRVYVNAALTPVVHVYDTASNEEIGTLRFPATTEREAFGSMDLKLVGGRLYSTSRATNDVAWVDVATGEGKAFKLEGSLASSGVAVDPETNRLFVVGQDSDNLMVVNGDTGEVIADTRIGAGALNVVFEPVSKRVFAVSRGASSLTVLDTDGKIVANLPAGKLPNHLALDGKGGVYVVSMAGEGEDGKGQIFHVSPK